MCKAAFQETQGHCPGFPQRAFVPSREAGAGVSAGNTDVPLREESRTVAYGMESPV